MLLLCDSIVRRELSPLKDFFPLARIIQAAKKAKVGLGEEIQGSKFPSTKLVKVYLTGERAAGRLVFLFLINKGFWIPVVLRLKKDKRIGANMTIKNTFFKSLLDKNLDLVFEDLKGKFYEKIPLS